jgi:hypothetical protein
MPNGIVDKFGGEGFAVTLEILALQDSVKLLNRRRRFKHFELPHEHDQSVHQRGLALEAVGSLLADLIKEVIEGHTRHEHLQNLEFLNEQQVLKREDGYGMRLTEFM